MDILQIYFLSLVLMHFVICNFDVCSLCMCVYFCIFNCSVLFASFICEINYILKMIFLISACLGVFVQKHTLLFFKYSINIFC